MDFRQAQRNLELIQEVDVGNESNRQTILDDIGLEEEYDDIIGTQIPSTLLSDDEDQIKLPNSEPEEINPPNAVAIAPYQESLNHEALHENSPLPQSELLKREMDLLNKEEVNIEHMVSATCEEEQIKEVFMSTQIQGRIDDYEQENSLRSNLIQFKYLQENEVLESSYKKEPIKVVKPPRKSAAKRSKTLVKNITQYNIENFEISRAENVLKLLSGKHNKVRDMISVQRNIENNLKSKKSNKTKVVTYDTYNAEEWKHIFQLILNKFPSTNQKEVNQVYHYIYGDDQETQYENLWEASQIPFSSMREGNYDEDSQYARMLPNRRSHLDRKIAVMSLSQVMDDKSVSGIELEKTDMNQEDMQVIEVPDSTDDEFSIIIPVNMESEHSDGEVVGENQISDDTVQTDAESSDTQFFTANGNIFDGVIDLTQGSFKAVNRLISPVKIASKTYEPKQLPQDVQVPATRMTTVQSYTKLEQTPRKASPLKTLIATPTTTIMYQMEKQKFQSIKELNTTFAKYITSIDQYDIDVGDSEEDKDFSDGQCMVEINVPNVTPPTSPGHYVQNIISSQSVQKLRESMKTIGLKPLRSKAKMVEALSVASRVLETDEIGQIGQRQEIFDHLTTLTRELPELLEKIYRFEPVTVEELVLQLIDLNPFIDNIDESTIKEWADSQGICIRKN